MGIESEVSRLPQAGVGETVEPVPELSPEEQILAAEDVPVNATWKREYKLQPGDPNFSYVARAFAEGRMPTDDESLKDIVSGQRARAISQHMERHRHVGRTDDTPGIALSIPERPQVEYRVDDQPPTPSAKVMNDKQFGEALAATADHARIGSPDAGQRAREVMHAHQLRMAKKRKQRIRFWTGWLVFLLLVMGVAFGVWKVLPEYVVTGRYTVPSECSAPLGKGEITGKREYSYAYKSLFGYHLVDESTALEKTVVNLKGDRMTILGWDKATGKTWRQDYDNGERGAPPLKPADIYWFLTDKEMATVPYTAFCK